MKGVQEDIFRQGWFGSVVFVVVIVVTCFQNEKRVLNTREIMQTIFAVSCLGSEDRPRYVTVTLQSISYLHVTCIFQKTLL